MRDVFLSYVRIHTTRRLKICLLSAIFSSGMPVLMANQEHFTQRMWQVSCASSCMGLTSVPGKGSPLACLCICYVRSEEHTSELQSLAYLVCRLLLEKKKKNIM